MILLAILLCTSFFGLEKREDLQPMKVSVVIPCHSKHFSLLSYLLSQYSQQTRLPEEIVISLSGVRFLSSAEIRELENRTWPFALKVIQTQENLSAAENRNIACRASSGDLLICQDADDFTHLRRVEVIQYLFENYKIDVLMHKFTMDYSDLRIPVPKDILPYCALHCEAVETAFHNLCQGCPALTKEVFQEIQWPSVPGEDSVFTGLVCHRFKNFVILSFPLYLYRPIYRPDPRPNRDNILSSVRGG
ncbi:MAG TPA: glycosyltransferase [Chlamydiales bacterium]|nr:glycosyltransferase [Chlamydiales bacterium]